MNKKEAKDKVVSILMTSIVRREDLMRASYHNDILRLAKKANMLVVYPHSQDYVKALGRYNKFYLAPYGTVLFCTHNALTADKHEVQHTPLGTPLYFTIVANWIDDYGHSWELITDADALHFGISLEGEVWGNGLIIDMDSYGGVKHD